MKKETSVATAVRSTTITVGDGTQIYYKDQINADLLAFIQA